MAKAPDNAAPRDTLALELRRGVLVLAVLSQLREDEYGYSLRKKLLDYGLEVEEGTLYPLLRRLESQGLVRSRWQLEEGRPRKYYALDAPGEAVLTALTGDWRRLTQSLERMLCDPPLPVGS